MTDAVHYTTTSLNKKVVYYSQDSSIYVRVQDALDGSSSEHISNLEEFTNRLENKKENEAFIISSNELNQTDILLDNYSNERFGDNFIIY